MYLRARTLIAFSLAVVGLPVAGRSLAQISRPPSVVLRLQAVDLARQAQERADQGDFAGAARQWEQVAELSNFDTSGYRSRAAWAWMDALQPQAALRLWEGPPLHHRNGAHLALAYFLAGNAEKALEQLAGNVALTDFDRVKDELARGVGRGPQDPAHRLARAHLMLLAGQPLRAYHLLQPLARELPQRADVQLYLADAAERLSLTEEAARARAIYIRLAPRAARASVFRAQARERAGQLDKAKAELDEGIARYPTDEYLIIALISLSERRKDPARITALLRAALEPPLVMPYGPPHASWSAGVQSLVRLGAWEELAGITGEVARRWPFHHQAHHEYARALVMLDRYADFVKLLEAPLPVGAPPNFARQGLVGVPNWLVYLAAGQKEKALAALPPPSRSPLFVPGGQEAACIRAWAAGPGPERQRLLAEAARSFPTPPRFSQPSVTYGPYGEPNQELYRKIWTAVAQHYPDCFPAYYFQAVFTAARDREAAAANLQRAAAAQPDWALPHWLLADYYRATGNSLRAAAESARATELLGGQYFPGQSNPTPPDPAVAASGDALYEGIALARKGEWEPATARLKAVTRYPYQEPAKSWLSALRLVQGDAAEAQAVVRTNFYGYGNESLYGPFPVSVRKPTPLAEGAPVAPEHAELVLAQLVHFRAQNNVRTPELVELLLQDAYRRAPEDRRIRTIVGAWLLRSNDVWPVGTPEQADAKRREEGRSLLESILKEDPRDPAALLALGREVEAQRLNEGNVRVLQEIAAHTAQPDLRLKALQRLKQLVPDTLSWREQLWQIYWEKGDLARALPESIGMQHPVVRPAEGPEGLAAIRRQVSQMKLRGLLLEAMVYLRQGNLPEARQSLDQLVSLPGGAEQRFGYSARLWAALVRMALGDWERARPLVREALIAGEPESPLPQLLLAWDYRRAGDEIEKWRMLTGVDPAQGVLEPAMPPGMDARPLLERARQRYPDCWALRFFLAARGVQRSAYAGRTGAEALALARQDLLQVTRELPVWSAPYAFLTRNDAGGYFSEALRRVRRLEARQLLRLAAAQPARDFSPVLRPLWRVPGSSSVAADERDIFQAEGGRLIRRSRISGAELAVVEGVYPNGPLVLTKDFVLLIVEEHLVAFARDDLRLRWTVPLTGARAPEQPGPAPVVDGDHCLWLNPTGDVVCLRLADGQQLWRTELKSSPTAPLQPLGERYWIALQDGTIRGLDRRTGAPVATMPIPAADEKDAGGRVQSWLTSDGHLVAVVGKAATSDSHGPRALVAWRAGAEKPTWVKPLPHQSPVRLARGRKTILLSHASDRWVGQFDPATGVVTGTQLPNQYYQVQGFAGAYAVLSGSGGLALYDVAHQTVRWEGPPGLGGYTPLLSGDMLLLPYNASLTALGGPRVVRNPQVRPIAAPRTKRTAPMPKGKAAQKRSSPSPTRKR